MEVPEISDRLDYELQKSSNGLRVDEYVKSLRLTEAQSDIVTQVLSSYEYGDQLRHVLEPLLIPAEVGVNDITGPTTGRGCNEFSFNLYERDILAIVYERFGTVPVIPLDYNDIHMTLTNPFRKPNPKINYRNSTKDKFTIFSNGDKAIYSYIYCKEPDPIILEDYTGTDLTVGGEQALKTSVLPDHVVLKVIELAAQKIVKAIQLVSPPPPPQRVKE